MVIGLDFNAKARRRKDAERKWNSLRLGDFAFQGLSLTNGLDVMHELAQKRFDIGDNSHRLE